MSNGRKNGLKQSLKGFLNRFRKKSDSDDDHSRESLPFAYVEQNELPSAPLEGTVIGSEENGPPSIPPTPEEQERTQIQEFLPNDLSSVLVAPPAGSEIEGSVLAIEPQMEPSSTSNSAPDGTPVQLNRVISTRQLLAGHLARIDTMAIAEKFAQIVQGRGYAFYGKLFTVLVCTFFLADVLAIFLGGRIPEPRASKPFVISKRPRNLDDYGIIMTRNLFSRRGLIPGEEVTNTSGVDPGGAPVKTTLPLNLLGTVILRDEMRSVAAIEDKSGSIVYPIRVDEEIPGKARIVKIEPTRVIFVNISANRREYVELPEDAIIRSTLVSSATTAPQGIEQVAPNQFNIDRKEVDKALGDLNNILTQARAVPNFENGVAAGYKLFQIVPHSIYDQLGLKNGDVIAGIDGQPVTDPGKAFELLNSLKTRANLELQVKRDGKTQTNSYDIH